MTGRTRRCGRNRPHEHQAVWSRRLHPNLHLAPERGKRSLNRVEPRTVPKVEHPVDLRKGDVEALCERGLADAFGPHRLIQRDLG